MRLTKWEGFWKAKCFHSLSFMLTKNRQKKTINTAFISSHFCLKNRVSDFWNVHLFYFYKQVYSGIRTYCHRQWEKDSNFEMKRKIKIRRLGFVGNPSDNNLAKFQPNWSRVCRSLKSMHNLPQFSYQGTRKNRISTTVRLAAPRCQVLFNKRKF